MQEEQERLQRKKVVGGCSSPSRTGTMFNDKWQLHCFHRELRRLWKEHGRVKLSLCLEPQVKVHLHTSAYCVAVILLFSLMGWLLYFPPVFAPSAFSFFAVSSFLWNWMRSAAVWLSSGGLAGDTASWRLLAVTAKTLQRLVNLTTQLWFHQHCPQGRSNLLPRLFHEAKSVR